MDGPGQYYAKWNKPVRERNTIRFNLYVESNEQNKQNRNRPIDKEKTDSWKRGGGLGEKLKGTSKKKKKPS